MITWALVLLIKWQGIRKSWACLQRELRTPDQLASPLPSSLYMYRWGCCHCMKPVYYIQIWYGLSFPHSNSGHTRGYCMSKLNDSGSYFADTRKRRGGDAVLVNTILQIPFPFKFLPLFTAGNYFGAFRYPDRCLEFCYLVRTWKQLNSAVIITLGWMKVS